MHHTVKKSLENNEAQMTTQPMKELLKKNDYDKNN